MSKSDRPVALIDTNRASSTDLGTPNWADDKPVNALDFETVKGEPFLLAVQFDDGTTRAIQNVGDGKPGLLDGPTLLSALTHKRMRSAINVWYNLNYDANIMLKALPRRNLQEIQATGSTTYETVTGKEYEITYVKKKFLRIKDSAGNQNYWHFDISQFTYAGGLDDAADKWLDGEGKGGDDLDVGGDAWNESLTDDGEITGYVAENWGEIRKYALKDVDLTRRVAKEIIRVAENEVEPAVPMGKPISTGYMAADFVRAHLEYKPGWAATHVQQIAWDAYAGGRFEVFERGKVGAVAGPDINSAYPAIMAELPDPNSLNWKRTTDVAEIRDAEMGFVRATVSTDADRRIQPFAVKNEGVGRVEYPALENAEITTIAPTFLFALDEGIVTDYDVTEAVVGVETDVTSKPFDFLNDLYDKRKRLEREGREKPALLLKIVMNSLYGKTCQTTVKTRMLTPDDGKVSPSDLEDWEEIGMSPFGEIPIVEYYQAGSFFNPVIASYITGMTRLELHKRVVQYGLESDTYMFATDCIMVDADAYEASDFGEVEGDTLGEWDFDYRGDDALIVASGVYEIYDDGDAMKTKARGFDELLRADAPTLAESIKATDRDDAIPVETTRPLTIGDAMAQGLPTHEIGVFKTTDRNLSADMDGKRDWPSSVEWADLLNGRQYGPPKVMTESTDL